MLKDMFGKPTIEITREQIESWAGQHLTDEQIAELEEIIPNSSIPDAIGTIVAEAMGLGYGGGIDWDAEDDEQNA